MAVFNAAKREIDVKIVYYGPALCGKTTNVQCIHKMLAPHQRGDIMSLATKDDRTLFFDFLPIELGDVKGFKTRFHVYTVPGQVYYALTRRAVLTGVDGVVFVSDSQQGKMDENIESLEDLNENLKYYKKDIGSVPFVIQHNKRDLDNLMSLEELDGALNTLGVPSFPASAVRGDGVMETLTSCCKLVLKQMDKTSGKKKKRARPVVSTEPEQPAAPAPGPEPAAGPQMQADDFDGNEPIIKIIDESAAEAGVSPADEPEPVTELTGDENISFDDFGAGTDLDLGEETPAAPPAADSLSLDDIPADATAEPEFNLDEPVAPPPEEEAAFSAPAEQEADSIPLSDLDRSSFGLEEPPPLETASVGIESGTGGGLTVTGCGEPLKIADTGVKIPLTVRVDETGKECTLTITISFGD